MLTFSIQKRHVAWTTTVVFLLLLLIPASIGLIYYQIDRNLTTQVYTQQETLTDLAASAVTIKINHLVEIATALASLGPISQDAAGGRWNDAAQVASDEGNNVAFYDTFIDRVIFYDASGTQQSAYPTLQGSIGKSSASSTWYQSLTQDQSENSFVSGASIRGAMPRIHVVNIAVPIRNGAVTSGFVVLQIPTNNFLEFGTDLSMGSYGFAYIVDSKGNIVAHPQYSSEDETIVNYSSVPAVEQLMAGKSGIMITYDSKEDERSIVSYKTLPQYQWGIVTQELYNEAFAIKNNVLSVYLLWITITLIFDVIFSWVIFTLLVADTKRKKTKK